MSLELGWMSPHEAAAYVEACVQAGLLVAEGDALRLSFDPRSVEVERGFRPDPSDLPSRAEPKGDAFPDWLRRVAQARGEEPAATMEAVEALQKEAGGLLPAEAALLLLGARAGLDVKAAAKAALART